VSSSSEPYYTEGTFIDQRDQQEYRWVTIGDQTWMGENLNYQGQTYSCNSGVDSLCDVYGALYNWDDAMLSDTKVCEQTTCQFSKDYKYPGICPDGWHVPQVAEWQTLFETVGNYFSPPLTTQSSYYNTMTYNRTYYWHDVGEHLKSTYGWEFHYTSNGVSMVNYYNGTDLFGFRALYDDGKWWTSGGYYAISLFLTPEDVAWSTHERNRRYHIRCVKDE